MCLLLINAQNSICKTMCGPETLGLYKVLRVTSWLSPPGLYADEAYSTTFFFRKRLDLNESAKILDFVYVWLVI